MEDYQKRVINERAELCTKIVKLVDFMHSSKSDELDEQDYADLDMQLSAMRRYHDILRMRIKRFD